MKKEFKGIKFKNSSPVKVNEGENGWGIKFDLECMECGNLYSFTTMDKKVADDFADQFRENGTLSPEYDCEKCKRNTTTL
ncbi:MAG: hypothetical protein PHT69_02445 [Bacteroidales bacterium]|nr:hypothetical protein [Bacteroidales bacterium]